MSFNKCFFIFGVKLSNFFYLYTFILKRILLVAATKQEILIFLDYLQAQKKIPFNLLFGQSGYNFDILITGVGIFNTSFELGRRLTSNLYDIAVNVGVAGSFSGNFKLGEVVEVVTEQYGDFGAEEADGSFTDIFSLKLINENEPPFIKNKLINKKPLGLSDLKSARGLTVQKVHGYEKSINSIKKNYAVDIETMEGAAFFQACLIMKIPFVQWRSISNYVTPRDKESWRMKEAIQSLNAHLINVFEKRLI